MPTAISFDQHFTDCLRASVAPTNRAVAEDDRGHRQSSWIMRTARTPATSSTATVTGLFAKLDGSVVRIESRQEFDYAEVLDADLRVADFRTQAEPLAYDLDGSMKETFFDFEMRLANGEEVLAAVKPNARQTSSGIRDIVERVAQIHARPSRHFVVVDEDHLADHQVRDARLVNRALREDPDVVASVDEQVLRFVAGTSFPAQVVDVQIGLGLHGRTLTSVARLLHRGLVQQTRAEELTISSRVVVTRDGLAALGDEPSGANVGRGGLQ